MSYLYSNKKQLAALTETTRGTYNAPTTNDIYDVFDLNFVDVDPQVKDLGILRSTLTRLPAGMVMGPIYGTVTFKLMALVGTSAVTAHVNAMTRFWNAAGLQVTSPSAIVIVPDDDIAASISIACNYDGRARTLRGCTGNMKLVLTAGEVPYWDCTFTGVYTGTTETAAISGTPFLTTPAVYSSTSAVTIADGTNTMYACHKTLEIDPGNSIAPFLCLSALQGVKYFARNAAAPKCTFTAHRFVSSDATTQYDAEADAAFRNGTQLTLTVTSAAVCSGKLESLVMTDDAGWLAWEGVIDLRHATAESEFAITIGTAG